MSIFDQINSLTNSLPEPPSNTRDDYINALKEAQEIMNEAIGTTGDSLLRAQLLVFLAAKLIGDIQQNQLRATPAKPDVRKMVCPHMGTPVFHGISGRGHPGWKVPCSILEENCQEIGLAVHPDPNLGHKCCLHWRLNEIKENDKQ